MSWAIAYELKYSTKQYALVSGKIICRSKVIYHGQFILSNLFILLSVYISQNQFKSVLQD